MKQSSIGGSKLVFKVPQYSIRQKSFPYAYRFLLFLVMLTMIASCKKDHDKKSVPLHATFTTTTTIVQAGPPELALIQGTGQGTPIGKSSFVTHAQFDENFNLTGAITLTAENGDQFFASITGHAPDINEKTGAITLHFQATITGGTGVFTGATGNFDGVAHESLSSPDGRAKWDGIITFN
jgi:hypothetical protein